jgi:hypothetical protein
VFSITAEFRAPRGGVRRKVLSEWREGESIMVALDRAAAEWAALSKESKPPNDLKGEYERSLAASIQGAAVSPPSDWRLRNQPRSARSTETFTKGGRRRMSIGGSATSASRTSERNSSGLLRMLSGATLGSR